MEISFEDIAVAMEDNRHYDEFFLNSETGDVIAVPRDVIDAVEDDDAESIAGTLQEMVSVAESFIFDPRTPLMTIPNVPFSEELRVISGFAERVDDADLKEQLMQAMQTNTPMRKCLRVLESQPAYLKAWQECKSSFYLEEAKKWVESLELE